MNLPLGLRYIGEIQEEKGLLFLKKALNIFKVTEGEMWLQYNLDRQ